MNEQEGYTVKCAWGWCLNVQFWLRGGTIFQKLFLFSSFAVRGRGGYQIRTYRGQHWTELGSPFKTRLSPGIVWWPWALQKSDTMTSHYKKEKSVVRKTNHDVLMNAVEFAPNKKGFRDAAGFRSGSTIKYHCFRYDSR